jgi:hypothetical protein
MSRTLLIVADLVSRQQIKAVLDHESVYIKSLEQLDTELANTSQVVLDLTNNKLELAQVLELIKKHNQVEQTVCFFPHIQSELAIQAEEAGFSNILPRSKFFSSLHLLND